MSFDIEKMRNLAKLATQGDWVVSDHIYAEDGKRVAMYHVLARDDDQNYNNAVHIAQCNPATMLEIFLEIEKLRADAIRWRTARNFLSIEDIESWSTHEWIGHQPNESESLKADDAIDAMNVEK